MWELISISSDSIRLSWMEQMMKEGVKETEAFE